MNMDDDLALRLGRFLLKHAGGSSDLIYSCVRRDDEYVAFVEWGNGLLTTVSGQGGSPEAAITRMLKEAGG